MTKQPYAKQAAFLALHGDEVRVGRERRRGVCVWGGSKRATGDLVGTKKGARALIPLPLCDDRREEGREGGVGKKWNIGGRGKKAGGEGRGMLALRGGTCCRRRRIRRRGNLGGRGTAGEGGA